jgi:hypothetical protein
MLPSAYWYEFSGRRPNDHLDSDQEQGFASSAQRLPIDCLSFDARENISVSSENSPAQRIAQVPGMTELGLRLTRNLPAVLNLDTESRSIEV